MKRRILLLALALVNALPLSASDPRPISAAERETLEIVAKFLGEGPRVLYDNLGTDAPFRKLPEAQAIEEIAARTGPAKGTTWTLQTTKISEDDKTGSFASVRATKAEDQPKTADVAFHLRFPSGVDDGLLFRMSALKNTWTIREIRSLAEPVKTVRDTKQTVAGLAKRVRIGLLIATAFLLFLGATSSRKPVKALFIALGTVGLTTALWFMVAPETPEELLADYVVPMPFVQLRDLVPLREALARGVTATVPPRLSDDARAVATLWALQSGERVAPGDPQVILGSAAGTPMGELMRGRIALAKLDGPEAARAFEQAAAAEPLRDDVVIAAANGFGELAHMAASFAQLDEMQSRDAGTYYGQAMIAAIQRRDEVANEAFSTAWTLEPLAREDVVRNPILFYLARNYGLFEPREKVVVSHDAGTAPLALPPGALVTLCGAYLRVDISNARLEIPNGAALAPRSAKVVTPTDWHRVHDEEAVADAERLLRKKGAAAMPALTERRQAAADALARHNRWSDFLRLTDDIQAETPNVDPQLLRDRITALLRRDRGDEARALAGGESVRKWIEHKQAPGLLLALADEMMSIGSFDLADRLYRGIDAPAFDAIAAARLRRLEIRRNLAGGALTVPTSHFDIRYDLTVERAAAEEIGRTFEAMLEQVEPRLPPSSFRRVAVNVLSAESFHRDIAGSDHILGLYDGEILLPYVKGSGITPELASTIAHELTHALVATATSDKAPRWFQEGLAQQMEPQPPPVNANSQIIPIQLLDELLGNPVSSDLMSAGYNSAFLFVRFLSERYPLSIPKLVQSFAEEKTTEEALTKLTQRSLDSLAVEFRDWQATASPAVGTTTFVAQTESQQQPAQPEPKKEKIEIRWSRRPRPQ